MHSTNYFNTFIAVAEDCPAEAGEVPPLRGTKKSVANLQFELLRDHPYELTSDEVLFRIHVLRKEVPSTEMDAAREAFFSKGQPCFRASPLTKRYGWGVHYDAEGRMALVGMDAPAYADFQAATEVEQVRAMRNKRK